MKFRELLLWPFTVSFLMKLKYCRNNALLKEGSRHPSHPSPIDKTWMSLNWLLITPHSRVPKESNAKLIKWMFALEAWRPDLFFFFLFSLCWNLSGFDCFWFLWMKIKGFFFLDVKRLGWLVPHFTLECKWHKSQSAQSEGWFQHVC